MTLIATILAATATLPVFKGFEAPRYQQHDALILRFVNEFNSNPALWAGCSTGQRGSVRKLDPALVKAHMIQETGGSDPISRASWAIDPLQVNVPGDWNRYKAYLGLTKPRHRNEGSRETNIRAGIKYLARKGFGCSGQPALNSPESKFDGWNPALQRYNGRKDSATGGKPYCEVYADKIHKRKGEPGKHVPIQIKK